MSKQNGTLRSDVEKLMNPVDSRGIINLTYGDGFFAKACEKKWGKERFNKACQEYRKYR